MIFLSWRDDYAVGVPKIDAEHQYLFGLINEFHDKHAAGATHKEMLHVLNRLISYTEDHFRHEEELMSRAGYPRLDRHHELHEELVLSVFSLNEKLSAGTAGVDHKVLQFLKRWLVEHILKEDMDVGDFLRRKAAQAEKALNAAAKDRGAEQLAAKSGGAKPAHGSRK